MLAQVLVLCGITLRAETCCNWNDIFVRLRTSMEILKAHMAKKGRTMLNGLLKWLLDLVLVFHGLCASKLMLQNTL